MQTEELQREFNAISEKYDQQRRILIPCFDDFYKIPTEIASQVTEVQNILDLGAGTGLMSSFFKSKFPQASFTLVDISESMLSKARERFANVENIQFVTSDITDWDIERDSYDLIISSLAIHHLENADKKLLFNKIYNGLREGGCFINADQVLGENAQAEYMYTHTWKNYVENTPHLTQEEKQSAFERIQLDRMAKLSEQCQWLQQSGFQEPTNYFQYYNFVVFATKK